MEHTATQFIYHDGLNHYDKEIWFDVEGFSGWAVVECNCKLETKCDMSVIEETTILQVLGGINGRPAKEIHLSNMPANLNESL